MRFKRQSVLKARTLFNKQTKLIQFNKQENNQDLYKTSLLNVLIKEGQNIAFETSYVSVTFKEQVFKTGDVEGEFPVYNQSARITGVALDEEVFITVIDSNNDDNNYTATVTVNDLVDQKIHDRWVDFGQYGDQNKPKLFLQLNYILSKAKICEDAIEKWDEYIIFKQEENVRLVKDFEMLYSKEDFLYSLKQKPTYFEEVRPVDKLNNDDVYEPRFHAMPPKQRHPILKVALIVSLILFLVAAGALDYRNHIIIDLFVVFFVITMYYFPENIDFNLFSLIFIIVILCASVGIETAWNIIYTKNWWESVYIDDGSLLSLRKWTYYNSLVSLVLKGLLVIILIVSIFLIDLKKKYDKV